MNKKELDKILSGKSNSSTEFLKKYGLYTEVTPDYLDKFITGAVDYINSAADEYGTIDYNSSSSIYDSRTKNYKLYKSQSKTARDYINKNRSGFSEENYNSYIKHLDEIDKLLDDTYGLFSDANSFYSSFANETLYNDYIKSIEADDKYNKQLTEYDVTKGAEGWDKYLSDVAASKAEKAKAEKEKKWYVKLGENWGEVQDSSLPVVMLNQAVSNYRKYGDRSSLPNDEWTDEEKYAFGALYTDDENSAFSFAKQTNARKNKTKEEEKLKAIQEQTNENWWTQTRNTLGAVFASMTGVADSLDNIAKRAAGLEVSTDGNITPFEWSQAVKGAVSSDLNEKFGTIDTAIGKIGWGDLYQLGVSRVESLLNGVLFGNAGTLVSYFGQASASGVSDALSRGASQDEAMLYGAACGVFEGLFEMISVGKLLSLKGGDGAKGFIKNLVNQAVEEGLEEGLTTTFSTIFDVWITADHSNREYVISQYMSQGLSREEAEKQAVKDELQQIAYDTIGGAVSGALGGAMITGVKNTFNNITTGREFNGNTIATQKVLTDAAEIGSKADKYINKFGEKGRLSGRDINTLLRSIRSGDKAKISKGAFDTLDRLGETGNKKAISEAIAKVIAGDELARSEKRTLRNSDYAQSVLEALNPETINAQTGIQSWDESNNPDELATNMVDTEWAENLNTKLINPQEYGRADAMRAVSERIQNALKLVYSGGDDNSESLDELAEQYGKQAEGMKRTFIEGQEISKYDAAFKVAFNMGKDGVSESYAMNSDATSYLTEEQKKIAYELGKESAKSLKKDSKDDTIKKTEAENGSIRIREGSKRSGSKDTEEQVSLVESGTGKTQVKRAAEGVADKEAARLVNEGREVSVANLGIAGGVADSTVRVVDKENETTSMQEARRLAEARGLTVTFFVGNNLAIKDKNENIISARAYISTSGKHVFVRGDHSLYTAEQLMRHELGHDKIAKGEISIDDVRERLKKLVGESNFATLAEIYEEAYAGSGLTAQEIWEEIICDSLGDMNVFAENAIGTFTGLILSDIKTTAENEAKSPTQTRGSPTGDVVTVIQDGQFYKVRGDDAIKLSKAVDLTLTQEDVNGEKVPMVGIPLRYFDTYAKKAASKGISLERENVKYSYSSIAYSFFGDDNISIKDMENGAYKKTEGYKTYVDRCLNNMRQSVANFNEKAALKEITESIDGIVDVAVAMKKAGYDILDSEGGRNIRDSKNRLLFSSLEPNSDYFTSSDISTICDKRINFAEIYDEIVRREDAMGVPNNKRFFNNIDNYFVLHKILADKGLTAPCRQCYVESMRKNLDPMANAFIELMQERNPDNKANKQLYQPSGKNKGELKSNNAKLRESLLEIIEEERYDITADDLTIKMLTTADGLAQLKMQAPLIYEAFNSFYGQSKPKMPKAATPFRFGELTALLTDDNGRIKKGLIDKIKSTGGFRLQSYSDFQIQNFADVLQVIFEAGTLGLNGHAYTKVPAFLDATKGTNLKRNISIFMYKDGGEWKIDRGDSFPYKLEKIYDIVDADKSGNTGIIAVVQNEDMAAWIMANNKIGYFIPFHKSGVKMAVVRDTVVREGGREIKGYSGIKDHTRQQTEVWAKTTADHKANTKVKKGINIYEFWDFDNVDNLSREGLIEKNVKAYIDACEDAGYLPKFREYVMNNSKVLNAVLNYSKQLGFVSQDAAIDDISFEYKGYKIPYGYYKCLGDFGMFTPDGEASPIERLSLKDYNFDESVTFFSDANTLRRNEILQQFENGTEREKYRNSDMTTAELAEEVAERRKQVVDEVLSGEYKKTTKDSGKTSRELDSSYLDAVTNDDAGNVIPPSERFNTEDNDIRYSERGSGYEDYSKPITVEDVEVLRSLGNKSVNDFTPEDIKITQKWAYKFYMELGEKSPFFRAWFGDWRAFDQDTTKVIDATPSIGKNPRGKFRNKDTGWEINSSSVGYDETVSHSGKNKKSIIAMQNIDKIIENAILLNTEVSEYGRGKKSVYTAFMHKFYALCRINGKLYIAKMAVDESYAPGQDNTNKKFYHVRAIEIETASSVGIGESHTPIIEDTVSNISIADLFNFVKTYDDKFIPTAVNPLLLNEDGTPKAFYHGTNAEFSVFDADKTSRTTKRYAEGFYFTAEKKVAEKWGKFRAKEQGENPKVIEAFLNVKNPLVMTAKEYQRLGFDDKYRESVLQKLIADKNDGIIIYPEEERIPGVFTDSYNYEAGDSVYYNADKYGITDKDYAWWLNRAVENPDFTAMQVAVFNPEQIKSATDNIGTFNKADSDIRYSRELDIVDYINENTESTEAISNRTLLANALESITTSEAEKAVLQQYKETISKIEAEEEKLKKNRAEAQTLRFKKGRTPEETKRLKSLDIKANTYKTQINNYDKKLLRLEATTSLKAVLEREVEKARKKAIAKSKEMLGKYRMRGEMGELRTKIKKFKSELESTLQNPTENKYIPKELFETMVEVCNLINIDTDLYKPDGTLNKAQAKRDATKIRLLELASEYAKIKDLAKSDAAYTGEFDEFIENDIKNLAEILESGNRSLADLDIDELRDVYDTLRSVAETIRDARKLIGFRENVDVYEAGDAIIEEQKNIADSRKNGKRSAFGKLDDGIANLSLSPVRAVERMTAYNEDSILYDLMEDVEIGVRKKDKFVMDAYKSFEALTSGKNRKTFESAIYDEVGKEYKDTHGKTFRVSLMEMMQAVLSFERETANKGQEHISKSGFEFADLKLLKKGKISEAVSNENAHRAMFTTEMFNDFTDVLAKSQWAQDYMNTARKFFNETAKDAVNEVTLATKHRIVARDTNYIPYEVDKNFVTQEISAEQNIQQTINSYGMLKDVKNNAPQPLIITGLNNIIERHIDLVSNVYGLAIPIRNFNKVWNVNGVGGTESVKSSIQRSWGDGGKKLIEQAIKDVQGARVTQHELFDKIYSRIKSGYVGATFLLNGSVVFKQIGSLFSAGSMLSYRNGITQMLPNLLYTMTHYKEIAAEVDKYTASAWKRRQGISDEELHTLMSEGKKLKLFRRLPVGLKPSTYIAFMDSSVALSLWKYAKEDVAKRTGLTGEELNKAAAAFYDRVIDNTQSMSDVLHRPEIQKQKGNVLADAFSMFKTDLYQMAGQLRVAAGRYSKNKTAENRRALIKTVWSIFGSAVWGTFVTSIFALIRYKVNRYRDDEDELTIESWLERDGVTLLSDLFGYINPLFGSELMGLVENVAYGESGNVVDSIVMDAVNNTWKAGIVISNAIRDGEEISNEQWINLAVNTLQVLGVPSNNIKRIVDAIRLHSEDISNGEWLSYEAGLNKPSKKRLFSAYNNKDKDRIEKATRFYETKSELHSAIRQALRAYEPRIVEAAEARADGKLDKYEKIVKKLVAENRFEKDDIIEAILSEEKAIRKSRGENTKTEDTKAKEVGYFIMSDYYTAITKDDYSMVYSVKLDVIDTMVANGYDMETAERTFNNNFANYLKGIYQDGDVSAANATEYLVSYGGKTRDEADSKVRWWIFQDTYPDYADWRESTVAKYYDEIKSAGISVDMYDVFLSLKGNSTKRAEVLEAIDSMPLNRSQKDALYLSEGFARSTLDDAPWN